MQTFLPLADFTESARVLDRQRLGKQRVENLQIMKALLVPNSGWANHPATKMWRGHENWLHDYHTAIVNEWLGRGYNDTCLGKMNTLVSRNFDLYNVSEAPEWLGDGAFHLSHRSNLIRKMPEHYGPMWPDVPDNLEYVWPVS